ncbi:prophage tail fiber N-terminal domain-containing protein [Serratia nevei]|uniref:phage tail fiber protein n=2 Tax=Serratia TaxID=613 RepID=UPI00074531D3|nr:prophage tail fiber N-terminal domain-containing protein [Serratia marcescens]MDF8317191.1 prophage tail fiber N-terminal domain-containing protein [Serratia nevei]MDF8322846.1 prophage tail fiber N-terminal domain-containing protein [Serratia nevei]MDF8339695.1 prophage tail fiber N-terminal domain-containing protein [Serratia nevei]MDF8342709.1 prophage tail fiber N-terminal domain-containing protein [Serratia nevei]MDF8350717.1 prophage tail fiber N-terminal domain-containing protein [Se
MALISGLLKGPYGDPRSGVTITMRSIKTSSTVLNLAKSQSVTDDGGKYSLSVEPGAYEVIVSVYGSQPERVGTIEVYTDSLPGTLNDFLRRPGESDITPEIVQTVDRLRADAALSADKSAASAAAAKISENNASATLANAAKSGANSDITSLSGLKTALSISQGGTGAKVASDAAQGVLSTSIYDRFTSAFVGNNAWMKITVKFSDTSNGKTIGFIIIGGSLYNGSPLQQGVQFVTIKTGNTNKDGLSNAVIHTLYGANNRTIKEAKLNTLADGLTVELYCRVDQFSSDTGAFLLPSRHANISDVSFSNVQVLPANIPATASDARVLFVDAWTNQNTTTDSNGFIKKASPIIRLSSAPEKMADDYLDGFTLSGYAAVNGEAEGVSAERVSVGVYKVTGALGFAEEGWNIEVPQDVNGNRLCFVSANTGKDGTIYVKVSKRRFDIDTAAIVAGEPMDIPEGRWIDLRLAMPAREEVDVLPPDALVSNDDVSSETNAVS